MNRADLLPQSSRNIAGEIPERILTSHKPVDTSLLLHRDKLLRSEILNQWNEIWSKSSTGAQTRLFFPSVEADFILDSPLTPFFFEVLSQVTAAP